MLTTEFYAFIRERESIRLRRAAGMPREQWTQDPILRTYKFTNVKREHDRTTMRLMKEFYSGKTSSPSMRLVNCTIARFFGLAATVLEIGWQECWVDETKAHVEDVIRRRISRREKVFTSAYIVPNCGDSSPKHEVVLRIVDQVAAWADANCEITDEDFRWSLFDKKMPWRWLIESLCENVRGMGSFMAKEVVLDFILASGWTPPDWHDWTPIGPGARKGAARVQGDGTLVSPLSEPKALAVAKELLESRDELWYDTRQWPKDIESNVYVVEAVLAGMPIWDVTRPVELTLTDIQFQLCEFDKYMREKTGDGHPKSLFTPTLI